jgi:hypothetical protein
MVRESPNGFLDSDLILNFREEKGSRDVRPLLKVIKSLEELLFGSF